MLFKRVLILGLSLAIASVSLVLAQAEPEQEFGVFKVQCKTDPMTDVRSCEVDLSPGSQYYLDHGVPVFLVFVSPAENNLTTSGFVRRLRVDKNAALVGNCIDTTTGLCIFRDKKANGKFVKEMAKGTTLHIETGGQILDFDLVDYRKALAAYNEVKTTKHTSKSQ